VKLSGDDVLVGITDFAVQELCSGNEGDLVYCDLPEPGRNLEAGETFGEIESVKAVADLNCPVAGTVAEVNLSIEEHLEILSRDPWNQGWLVKLTPKSKSLDAPELMDAEAYEAFITASKH
jgi:glycine cleavage system H protein